MTNKEDNVRTKGHQPPGKVTGVWWIVYALASMFFLVLGVLGLILPGLPTTPFLLLTSFFLVRISPRLNDKLLKSRFIGPILTDWQVKRGVRSDVKFKAVSVVVIAVGVTIYLSRQNSVLTFIVIGLASIGVAVILRLPSISD